MSEEKCAGWKADADDKGNWFVLASTPLSEQDVAAVCTTNGYGEREARLISAAPEMLVVARDFDEALTELGMHCECGEADCRTTRLRVAIAKATGSAA
jgi:hypothetical protein